VKAARRARYSVQMAIEARIHRAREKSKGEDGRVRYALSRELHLEGELSEEARARLVEIAGKCPIHRILTGDVRIETRLA